MMQAQWRGGLSVPRTKQEIDEILARYTEAQIQGDPVLLKLREIGAGYVPAVQE